MPNVDRFEEVIGLVPAGGTASRVAPMPCSKEIFPVGFHPVGTPYELRPKAAIHHLLENMRNAGAGKAYIILRHGKWDIPAYLGDGKLVGLPLGYLMMDLPFGVPFTLDQAFPFAREATVLFGFPDILCQPDDAFRRLREQQAETRSDLVLGLFPVHRPQKMDMVALDAGRRICEITIKPRRTDLRYTWILAVWTTGFTLFLHEYVSSRKNRFQEQPRLPELYLGDVIQAAIHSHLKIENVIFEEGNYIDIGTPEDLFQAIRRGQ